MKSAPSQKDQRDIAEGVWASNRWPVIGLFMGWGIGGILWVLFPLTLTWWLAAICVFVLGCVACALGAVFARLAFGPSALPFDNEGS